MVVTEGYEGYKMQWQLNKRKVGLNKWKAMYPKQNLDIDDILFDVIYKLLKIDVQ